MKKTFFKDLSFNFEFIRILGAAVYQGADIGECLVVASNIQEGNFESWYHEWYSMAEKIYSLAEKCHAKGSIHSVKSAYLRASNYYRTSHFYLHGNKSDSRIIEASRKSSTSFYKAIQFDQAMIETVKIPYENTSLPGYFYHSHVTSKIKKPTLIIHSGFDGTQEELFGHAIEGIKRGYNVLTFDGPGQGSVLYEQNLPFRPDWEKVISPVIDYLCSRSEVDETMIMLYGLSLGGYMAPRAASFDKRITILIANGGVYDPVLGMLKNFSFIAKTKQDLIMFIEKHPKIFNAIMHLVMRYKISIRRFFEHGMYAFHAKNPSEFILKFSQFSLHTYVQNIVSTTLICDVDNEKNELAGQAQMLYNYLTCPKNFVTFKSEDGAGYHCQIGALLKSNQVIFDWIDEKISLLKQT